MKQFIHKMNTKHLDFFSLFFVSNEFSIIINYLTRLFTHTIPI